MKFIKKSLKSQRLFVFKAVIYVEALQTVVMVVGATILTVSAFNEISGESMDGSVKESGWDSLYKKYECAIQADYKTENDTLTGILQNFSIIFQIFFRFIFV